MINCCRCISCPLQNRLIIVQINIATRTVFFRNKRFNRFSATYCAGNFDPGYDCFTIGLCCQIIWMDCRVIVRRIGYKFEMPGAFRAKLQDRCGEGGEFVTAFGHFVGAGRAGYETGYLALQALDGF